MSVGVMGAGCSPGRVAAPWQAHLQACVKYPPPDRTIMQLHCKAWYLSWVVHIIPRQYKSFDPKFIKNWKAKTGVAPLTSLFYITNYFWITKLLSLDLQTNGTPEALSGRVMYWERWIFHLWRYTQKKRSQYVEYKRVTVNIELIRFRGQKWKRFHLKDHWPNCRTRPCFWKQYISSEESKHFWLFIGRD